MNPEDETFLSAYLDGELTAAQRSVVDAAVGTSPVLADHLRELGAVRDLVAGLPRPALSVDLSGPVVAAIQRRSVAAVGLRRRVLIRTVGGLAAAASVVLALTVGLRGPARPLAARNGPAGPAVVAAKPAHIGDRALPPVAPAEPDGVVATANPDAQPVASGRPARPIVRSTAGTLDVAEIRRDRDLATVRNLLDNPELTRIFVVVDVIGGNAGDRVNKLVHDAPRLDPAYGRITVSQGIVIDPKHPNRATVFALVADDREMKHLRDTLNHEFPDAVREEPADPSFVTRLSGIGDVALLSGTRATELLNPAEVPVPGALALAESTKTGPSPTVPSDEFPEHVVREADPTPPDAPADPHRELSGPPDAVRRGAEPAGQGLVAKADAPRLRPRDAASPRKPAVVLVWVTTPAAAIHQRED